MMGNIMEYKGYHTKIEFDAEKLGKIQNGSIKEHLTFGFLQNFIKNWHCVHLKMDVLLMQRSNFFARKMNWQ